MTRALRHEWHTLLYDPDVGLSTVAKVIGGALIEHANQSGVAWPSFSRLRDCTELGSDHSVDKGLRELERRGLLVIERRAGHANSYRLVLPEPATALGAEVPLHEPPHPVQTNQGTKEPVRPSVVRADTQKLVAHYVGRLRALGVDPVPRDLIGKTARVVGRLVDDGIEEAVISAAVDLLVEGRHDPSLLPSLVPEAVAGPGARRGRQAEHPIDRRVREVVYDASELLHGPTNDLPVIDAERDRA